jgi:hypothetical protein
LKDTPEQLESRKQLNEFLEKMHAGVSKIAKGIRSEWFSRPDEELQGWIERGRALAEIRDTMGYRLILAQTDKEILWAQAQLEVCEEHVIVELRVYLRSLRFLKDFILTTEKNADISSSVLAGRPSVLAKDTTTFVKNAVVNEERN